MLSEFLDLEVYLDYPNTYHVVFPGSSGSHETASAPIGIANKMESDFRRAIAKLKMILLEVEK